MTLNGIQRRRNKIIMLFVAYFSTVWFVIQTIDGATELDRWSLWRTLRWWDDDSGDCTRRDNSDGWSRARMSRWGKKWIGVTTRIITIENWIEVVDFLVRLVMMMTMLGSGPRCVPVGIVVRGGESKSEIWASCREFLLDNEKENGKIEVSNWYWSEMWLSEQTRKGFLFTGNLCRWRIEKQKTGLPIFFSLLFFSYHHSTFQTSKRHFCLSRRRIYVCRSGTFTARSGRERKLAQNSWIKHRFSFFLPLFDSEVFTNGRKTGIQV